MGRSLGHRLKTVVFRTVLSLISLLLLLPILLYIPPVQDFVKEITLHEINKRTGMDIGIDYLRLYFPLRVEFDGVFVVDASGDTMSRVGKAAVDVKFLPLFSGNVDVRSVKFDDILYRSGTTDSAMYLVTKVPRFELSDANYRINDGKIEIKRIYADNADVELILKDTAVVAANDTSVTVPLTLDANDIELSRVKFKMKMLPAIDSLGTAIDKIHICNGAVDMSLRSISAGKVEIDSVSVSYIMPTEDFLHNYSSATKDTVKVTINSDNVPWSVHIDELNLTGRQLTYARAGTEPTSGLDMNYLQVSNVAIEADSLYNCGSTVRLGLKRLTVMERCGLRLDASGFLTMDSAKMEIRTLNVATDNSKMRVDATMGISSPIDNSHLPVMLNAEAKLSIDDILLAMPSLKSMFRGIPRTPDLILAADIGGTIGSLDVNKLELSWPTRIKAGITGHVDDVTDFDRMSGQVDISGSIRNMAFLKTSTLGAMIPMALSVPSSKITGSITYSPRKIDGKMAIITGDGRMAFDAKWIRRVNGYDMSLIMKEFPIESFMPSLGLADISLNLSVTGNGYDPLSTKTKATIKADLISAIYNGERYSDIEFNANIESGNMKGHLVSHNPYADFTADINTSLKDNVLNWVLDSDLRHLDMKAMKLSETDLYGSVVMGCKGAYNMKSHNINAELQMSYLDFNVGTNRLKSPSVKMNISSTDSLCQTELISGDLSVIAKAYCSLDSVMSYSAAFSQFATNQIAARRLDVRALQAALPHMDMSVEMGRDNIISDYLSESEISFADFSLAVHNDSLLSGNVNVSELVSDKIRMDDVKLSFNQHGKFLVYRTELNNHSGTMDDFAHVRLIGYIADDKFSALLRQSNIRDEQGFNLGMVAQMSDSTVVLRFVPYNPVIGYKKWTVNADNMLAFNYKKNHIDANLSLQSNKSLIRIFTEHDETDSVVPQEDVVVQMSQIHLTDWLSISPFSPPVKGDLGADMRFRWTGSSITGRGSVSLDDLYYGRDRVGSFDVNLNIENDKKGALRADMDMFIDSVKVITAVGSLNDSTARNPFLLDFSMIRFPLRVINPFLPKNTAQLSGVLNGRMDITGSMSRPLFNGYLDFDTTKVKIGLLGTSFNFSEDKIPVDSNVVRFNDFTISGLNANPLHVNGTVDASNFGNIAMDLALQARDMQIVSSSRPRGADIYGKAFVDFDARIGGNMQLMKIKTSLNILPGTNVTYVMSETQSAITSKNTGDMVQFVEFNDTSAVVADTVRERSLSMILDANIAISDGATINADISTDGKNKASVEGTGYFTFSLDPMNDGRLTGRYTINKGFVRYTPPLMSEKNFVFDEGSYIAFTGDMMNPTLGFTAVDKIKANVVKDGQNSRLVNFDVILSVSNTLQNMNVAFDLSTNEDLTVENELAAMSPEQRANQAMNLLLYNTYTGPGTKASANISRNPLFSFVESRLNTWAANNIKGVDISFGIDQYDTTTDGTTSTTTSYSYKVSKTLFNDRFKIVVGGNYSTDADADENFAQNLINDISFEYMLNRSGSMYLRLFRHVGYESILEGEITQTGVGFVLKRKLNSLRDIFRRSRLLPQTNK